MKPFEAIERELTELGVKFISKEYQGEPFINISDRQVDTGLVLECIGGLSYYFWEAGGGSRTKPRPFTDVKSMLEDLDRFILDYHSADPRLMERYL
jgi:hypothetical protein